MYRDVLLWIHIASAGSWLGANLAQIMLSPRFAKQPAAEAKAWTDQTVWLGERFYPLAGALIAITGVLLVIDTPITWSSTFIWIGVAVVVIGGVLGGAVFGPLAKRRSAALEAGDEQAAAKALSSIFPFAYLDTALVLLAMFSMVAKWGLDLDV